MKNVDSPVTACEFNGFGQYAPEAHYGLTKREIMAKNLELGDVKFQSISDLERFIGREVDQGSHIDIIKSQLECAAKLKVMSLMHYLLSQIKQEKQNDPR